MIEKWEGEQARNLNNMPQTEREKEAWRNLGRPVTLQGVKLKMDGRKASSKKEVVPIVEGYWCRRRKKKRKHCVHLQ